MRGTNSNHTKVLVDGIDVSDPSNPNGAYDFGKFSAPTSRAWKCCAGRNPAFTAPTPSAASINVITKSGEGPLTLVRRGRRRQLRHLQPKRFG